MSATAKVLAVEKANWNLGRLEEEEKVVKARNSQTLLMCLELTSSTILAISSNSSGHNPLLKCQVPASLPHVQVPAVMQSHSPWAFSFTHTVGWPQPAAHPPAHPTRGTLCRIAIWLALCPASQHGGQQLPWHYHFFPKTWPWKFPAAVCVHLEVFSLLCPIFVA